MPQMRRCGKGGVCHRRAEPARMKMRIKIKKDCRLQTTGWRKGGGIRMRIKIKMKGGD